VQAEADADTTHPSVTQLPIEERLILQGNEMIGLYGAGLLDTDLQALVQLLLAATEGSDSPVLLGRDGRFSSPLLHKTALKALTDAGRDVADMGLCPAPALAFMIASGSFSEGLMISGGHRPGTFNAVRIFANGQPVYIERSALDVQRNQPPRSADRPGKIDSIADPMAAYTQAFCQDIVLAASPRILVDCANGVAGLFIKPLYESLGLEVKLINHPLDGDFPAHETPDPSWHSNLKELAEAVRQEAADIGVMFDSDGRRFGVVDASGNFISSDRLMLLHSSDILSRHPGASIVVEQNTTRSLHEAILHNGGRLELAAPGIWHLHEQLQGNAAMLAGNRKGDMIFADRWPGIQDGIYAFARTLEYLSNYNLDLGEALEGWPEMPRRVAARYNVPDQSLSTVMLQLADADWGAHFRPTSADSLRLEASEGWALLEPDRERRQLLLVCEAVDEAALETLVASITSLLKPLMETLRIKEI
jgi:phosphomannomutase/phosphoglucomutase